MALAEHDTFHPGARPRRSTLNLGYLARVLGALASGAFVLALAWRSQDPPPAVEVAAFAELEESAAQDEPAESEQAPGPQDSTGLALEDDERTPAQDASESQDPIPPR